MRPFDLFTSALLFLPVAAFAQGAPSHDTGSRLNGNTLHGAAPYGTPINDERFYVHGIFTQLEGRFSSQPYFRWDGQAWTGSDHNRLWLKSEGRYNQDGRGLVSDGDTELLYDKPFSTYFNYQIGVRSDLDSNPNRTWGAIGIQGLAVGNWNVEATAYVSNGGRFAFKSNASWEYRMTQRLILQPQFETNWYTQSEQSRGVGSGLSDIDTGLRLRYEIRRKFAPYVGISYQQFLNDAGTFRERNGSSATDVRGLVGIREWF